MKSEDLDKLFNERLGKMHPAPSADLWNRLQDRMVEEHPAQQESKPVMMWARSYAVAAAITVLLSAGLVFYNVQQEAAKPTDTLAQVEQKDKAETLETPVKSDQWVNKSLAVTTPEPDENEVENTPVSKESITAIKPATEVVEETASVQKPVRQPEKKQSGTATKYNSKHLASNTKKLNPIVEPELLPEPEPTVSFASSRTDMNAAPVEIIIKRSVAAHTPESEKETPVSDFSKKQELVKNIFKQVKNLSNGEQVNLSEVGLNADRIALETKIGKQKISKVINL